MGLLSRVKKLLGFIEQIAPAETETAAETPAIEREFQRQLYEQITLHYNNLAIELSRERLLFDKGQLVLESSVFERTEHPNAVVLGLRLCLTH